MAIETDLTDMPGHLIRHLQQHSNAVFQKHAGNLPTAITSVQFAALVAVAREPGMDQARLAEVISYDRATIGEVVKRLVHKGLIARGVNGMDRRARTLTLTPAGQNALAHAGPMVADLQKNILNELSPTERAQFITLAKKALGLSDAS